MMTLNERFEHARQFRGVFAIAFQHHLSTTQGLEQGEGRENVIDDEKEREQTEHVVIDPFRDAHVSNEKTDDRMPDGIERDEH